MDKYIKFAMFLFTLAILLIGGAEGAKVEAAKRMASPTVVPTASASATPAPTEIKIKDNITEPNSPSTAYRLESVLEKQQVGGWNGLNTIRKMVRMAVSRGVAANTIVLLLMLPLVATVVSALHYVVGLSGYGIFMPTMVAVTFLTTGIFGGLTLFAIILMISLISNWLLKKFKLHFWPARSINLMLISAVTFGMMTISTYVPFGDMSKISIFPVLFMILLVEEFVRTQLAKSKKEAVNLTMGTLILAIVGSAVMEIRVVQEWVLLNPELTLILVLVVNVIVGNYSGIRWLEIKRFRKAIRKK
jgi:hypothetical protein